MKYAFMTQEIIDKLLDNGSPKNRDKDHVPVVKLFTPDANGTWLLTELLPQDPDIAFGLCYVGLGYPELGYVDLNELNEVRGNLGLSVERDISFEGKFPISIYQKAAQLKERITEDTGLLNFVANVNQMPSSRNKPSPN
jgi:hypothetical protein